MVDELTWFSRARRTKLKQTEVDCELLKRCCESLTEENRRLQRELQELRALKFAPLHPQAAQAPPSSAAQAAGVPAPPQPFYMQMQLPAATLSLCPSCERLAGPAAAAKAEPDRPKAATHHFFNPFTHSAACWSMMICGACMMMISSSSSEPIEHRPPLQIIPRTLHPPQLAYVASNTCMMILRSSSYFLDPEG